MVTGIVRPAARREQALDPTAAIDDLIKFRVVEAMLRRPDTPVSATEIASSLGFHSAELTGMAMDELVDAAVLGSCRRDGELRYRIVGDPRVRAEVAHMVAMGPPSLFTRLAAGSVKRIRRILHRSR